MVEAFSLPTHHPIWSQDRHDHVAAMDLRLGERLKNLSGDTVWVQQKLPRPGPTPVYNLEVQDEHVYYVGTNGVLAHNTGCEQPVLGFRPHWTGQTINYKKGAMSPIEHIFYRHGPNSGFQNVGKFTHGTNARDIVRMVDEAISFGKTTFNMNGKGGSILYDFRQKIGTHRTGSDAHRLQIFFNERGEIMTAFPLE